ncbi:MAG: hypothetical protein ABH852_00825 [Methanobacteriota archaeon]
MLKMAALIAITLILVSGTCYVAGAQENFATVHGTVYYWFTLEPLKNSIVEVNTTPRQTHVATDGQYSFELSQGEYMIAASYWKDNLLLYYAEENLTILGKGGDYVVDLIAFPTFDDNEIPLDNDLVPIIEINDVDNTWFVAAAAVAVGAAAVAIFYYIRIRSKRKPIEVKAAEALSQVKIVGLPEDLQEIVEKVKEGGGRINQLELRQKLPYSEAKVSLMLADLESRGLIRKIKKGRGNIIILKE